MPITITQENIDKEVFQSSEPVILDIFATWCGPCQFMEPVIDELEKELEGQYKFAKINVDESRELSIKLGVTSVPTFIFVQNGQIKAKTTGQMSKEDMLEKISDVFE